MQNYRLEFILHTRISFIKEIRDYLVEFSEELLIEDCPQKFENGKDFKISLSTPEPTVIFDVCSQFARIRSVKISEESCI
ncbi:MAG: hypothetical protein QMD94_01145 [Candidatus Omnitrophota bacterium]|nr:hypothetical protein [Candidatus Omnitrophota bacterium]